MIKSRNLRITLGLVAFAACESSVVAPDALELAEMRISPQPALVEEQGTLQLSATLLDASGNQLTGVKVFWGSEDATVVEVSDQGVVTGLSIGTTKVAASAQGISTLVEVSVGRRSVAAVEVSPVRLDIATGEVRQLNVTPRDRATNAVPGRPTTWKTSNPGVATVDAAGRVLGVAAGAATITATVDEVSRDVPVTVTQQPVATVEIHPGTATVIIGGAERFVALPRAADGTLLSGRGVFWSTSNPAVVTVSAEGVVRGIAAGAASVTALVEGKSASANVSVSVVPIAQVQFTAAPTSLPVGSSEQLAARAVAADGSVLPNRVITWTSSNPSVAAMDVTGRVTGRAPGTVVITAASEGKTSETTVGVAPAPVHAVEISPPTSQLLIGSTRQFSVLARDRGGNVLGGRSAKWSSSAPGVATINGAGMTTALAAGQTTIRVEVDGVAATGSLTVTAPTVGTLEINPTSAELAPRDTRLFTIVARSANGTVLTGRAVGWASSNPAAATVAPGGVVTAVAPGMATITATVDGMIATSAVRVLNAPVGTITIDPDRAQLVVGGTRQFTATAKGADGGALGGRAVSWVSSRPTIATVSSSGLVTAVATGEATISATSEGKTASAVVAVSAIPVASIQVTPVRAVTRPLEPTRATKGLLLDQDTDRPESDAPVADSVVAVNC